MHHDERQQTPNTVEELRRLWKSADKAANTPEARAEAQERIRETLEKIRRRRAGEAAG